MFTGRNKILRSQFFCINNAIEEEENDKRALRSLSMVIRKLPTKNTKEKMKVLKESIEYAKKAVAWDFKDSESWYVLGNAHLTYFMANQQYENLNFALKAYTQSEQHQVYQNPDLYYNRATLSNYLEQYDSAIADYEVAHSIDPNLGARDRARAIEDFVINVVGLIKKKGTLKNKMLGSIVKSVPKSIGELKFIKTTQSKYNKGEVKLKSSASDESGEEVKEQVEKEDNHKSKHKSFK